MAALRRLVLDVLKPHAPSVVELARRLSDLSGVTAVNVSVVEVDQKVENVKITLEGDALTYDEIEAQIRQLGAAVHSIDEVVAGARIIDDPATPQD
ncbi:MAG: DUF211 domain-containing protein [Alphaproteobacteria bacterium]|nr:DUF211 domain-containing protein [Alphaproteobacteria bacterium]